MEPTRICGSSFVVDELRQALQQDLYQIHTLNRGQSMHLQTLSATCHDSSLETMQLLCNSVLHQLQAALPDMQQVLQALQEYSDFLEVIYAVRTGCIYSGAPAGTRPASCQILRRSDTGITYDSPEKVGPTLDLHQGKTGLGGSCGICSSENIARMAGQSIDEGTVFALAHNAGLCDADGGTSPDSRSALLRALGLPSHLEAATPETIAAAVLQGRGVILSVRADSFYNSPLYFGGLHAVTVTSVVLDLKGHVREIILCDSNGDAARHCTTDELCRHLSGRPMNVTDNPIR